MPHFIVECTENIRQEARLPELFASVNTALAATGIFPLGGIQNLCKTRHCLVFAFYDCP